MPASRVTTPVRTAKASFRTIARAQAVARTGLDAVRNSQNARLACAVTGSAVTSITIVLARRPSRKFDPRQVSFFEAIDLMGVAGD
jgi:hypothetical protein